MRFVMIMSTTLPINVYIDVSDDEYIRATVDLPETMSDCLLGHYLAGKVRRRWNPTQRVYITNW